MLKRPKIDKQEPLKMPPPERRKVKVNIVKGIKLSWIKYVDMAVKNYIQAYKAQEVRGAGSGIIMDKMRAIKSWLEAIK